MKVQIDLDEISEGQETETDSNSDSEGSGKRKASRVACIQNDHKRSTQQTEEARANEDARAKSWSKEARSIKKEN